jgi:hypothetical protein
MNSEWDKFYIKIVAFVEIYNFVFIWNHLGVQIIDILFKSGYENRELDSISIIWVLRWLQMEKNWATK